MGEDSGAWIKEEFAQESRDIERRQLTIDRMRAEQNLKAGALAGFVASVAGAGAWATISAWTNFQIGWMAFAVAALVGYAIRRVGKGIDAPFGYVGAALALWGCVLGNYLLICSLAASQSKTSFLHIVVSLSPAQALKLLVATLSPYDLLFYGLALYAGYRMSIRQVTEADITRVVGP